jgi:hypothetical protein
VRFVAKNTSGAGTGRERVGDDISPAELLSDHYRLVIVHPMLNLAGDARLSYDQKMAALDAVAINIDKIRERLRAQAGDVVRHPRPAKMKRTRCGRKRRRGANFVKPT